MGGLKAFLSQNKVEDLLFEINMFRVNLLLLSSPNKGEDHFLKINYSKASVVLRFKLWEEELKLFLFPNKVNDFFLKINF